MRRKKVIYVTARKAQRKKSPKTHFFAHLAPPPPVPLKIAFLNNIYRCCARVIRMTNYLYVFFGQLHQQNSSQNKHIRKVGPRPPARRLRPWDCSDIVWLEPMAVPGGSVYPHLHPDPALMPGGCMIGLGNISNVQTQLFTLSLPISNYSHFVNALFDNDAYAHKHFLYLCFNFFPR